MPPVMLKHLVNALPYPPGRPIEEVQRRYGLKKEYIGVISWIDEHGPQAFQILHIVRKRDILRARTQRFAQPCKIKHCNHVVDYALAPAQNQGRRSDSHRRQQRKQSLLCYLRFLLFKWGFRRP